MNRPWATKCLYCGEALVKRKGRTYSHHERGKGLACAQIREQLAWKKQSGEQGSDPGFDESMEKEFNKGEDLPPGGGEHRGRWVWGS